MKMRLLFLLMLGLCACPNVWADSSSTNYALAEDRFTGGGGSNSSANYQVTESLIGSFSAATMTSTNYAVDPKIGVSSGPGIATVNSISPGDYSKLYSDVNAAYTVSAATQDGDSLQYSAKQDSTTKVSAQSSNSLSWSLATSDQGRHTMSFSVIDPQGTTLKKQEAYVVRRPTK